jgi:hypothetical protein
MNLKSCSYSLSCKTCEGVPAPATEHRGESEAGRPTIILHILGEATEPLFPSQITELLNSELGAGMAYTMTEVVMLMKELGPKVEQTPDGRSTLKGRIT